MRGWADLSKLDRLSALSRRVIHDADTWPLETCGFLYPHGPIPVRNISDRPRHEYAMDPGHQLIVMKRYGWPEAVWHSHPAGTREPSTLDLRSAMPRIPMAIGARGGWFGVWLDQLQIMEVVVTQGTNDTVEVFEDEAGEWRWRRKAPNGQEIAGSGEGYTRHSDAARAARRANPDAFPDLPHNETSGASDAVGDTAGNAGGGAGYTPPTPPATGPAGGIAGTGSGNYTAPTPPAVGT